MTALLITAENLCAQGAYGELISDAQQSVAAPVSAPSVVAEPAGVDSAPAPAAEREWLVMVYISAVNDLGILGFAEKSINELEKIGSSDRVTVVVEYGMLGVNGSVARDLQFQRGSKTIYINRDADLGRISSPVVYSSNDTDLGSAAHLTRFVKRGIRRYPAKKTALIVWGHGEGRLGIGMDDVGRNHIEVDQLGASLALVKQALGRKLDVFATDACFMQTVGVAYELKDSADVIVGSEETVPNESFPYDTILGPLVSSPGMAAEAFGALLVDAYGARYKGKNTLSALRASALPGFVGLLDSWVNAVKADPEAFKTAASKDVVDAVYRFDMKDSKDLYDYLANVEAVLTEGSPVKEAGVSLRSYIKNRLMIRFAAPPSTEKAHGLAIYIPDLLYNSANYERLAISRDSQWDDFLRAMMAERLK